MSFQQYLLRRIWKPVVKRENEIYMVIRGKILSAVRLSDIDKVIEYGREVSLTEYEVNKSRDLQNAINRCWVEVVYDRSLLKRALVAQKQEAAKIKKDNEEEIMLMAKKMAYSMAEEMVKNSPLVKEIAKQLAKEMATEIKDKIETNIRTEQIIIPQQENKIELDNPDSIFVDFKDEDAGITANIKKSGNVKVQKDDLSSSLERMKRFKTKEKE